MKNVMILTGAGQIGMAIARRMGYGMKIVIGDKKPENAQAIAKTMNDAGFDVVPVEMDLSNRASIQNIISEAQKYGGIYPQDIALLQKDYADLWGPLSELLRKLSQVVEM